MIKLEKVQGEADYALVRPLEIDLRLSEDAERAVVTIAGYDGEEKALHIFINDEGEVCVTVDGAGQIATVALGNAAIFQASQPLADIRSGDVLDVGDFCLYDVLMVDTRPGRIHLILQGDDAVWHLDLPDSEQLVPSTTQENLWALRESVFGTKMLRVVY